MRNQVLAPGFTVGHLGGRAAGWPFVRIGGVCLSLTGMRSTGLATKAYDCVIAYKNAGVCAMCSAVHPTTWTASLGSGYVRFSQAPRCAVLHPRCYWATMRRKLGLLAADEGAADRALIEDLLQARGQTASGRPWSVRLACLLSCDTEQAFYTRA